MIVKLPHLLLPIDLIANFIQRQQLPEAVASCFQEVGNEPNEGAAAAADADASFYEFLFCNQEHVRLLPRNGNGRN